MPWPRPAGWSTPVELRSQASLQVAVLCLFSSLKVQGGPKQTLTRRRGSAPAARAPPPCAAAPGSTAASAPFHTCTTGGRTPCRRPQSAPCRAAQAWGWASLDEVSPLRAARANRVPAAHADTIAAAKAAHAEDVFGGPAPELVELAGRELGGRREHVDEVVAHALPLRLGELRQGVRRPRYARGRWRRSPGLTHMSDTAGGPRCTR